MDQGRTVMKTFESKP